MTLSHDKIFESIVLYVGVYSGTKYYRSTPKSNHIMENYQFRSAIVCDVAGNDVLMVYIFIYPRIVYLCCIVFVRILGL